MNPFKMRPERTGDLFVDWEKFWVKPYNKNEVNPVSYTHLARKVNEGEYEPADYLPVSDKDVEVMYKELMGFIGSVKNQYLSQLLHSFFDKDVYKRQVQTLQTQILSHPP